MLSCKEVTRLVSEGMDRRLSLGRRIAVRIHLVMCKFCSRYRRQILLMREVARHYTEEVEPSEPFASVYLSAETRKKIKHFIAGMSDQ